MIRDMTRGNVTRHLVSFSVPIILGNLFQLAYNAVDSIVVGRFAGTGALAAVGTANPVMNIIILGVSGLCIGASVLMSEYFGARDTEKLRREFAATLFLGLFFSAAVLALGIGVQNLPEGLAVALPFRASGLSRGKSFALGALSGAVEPVFGMLAALMMGAAQSALPGMMAFCAGAMMQVVFAEMIPQAAKTRAGVAGVMAGYTLMMALDLALG